MMAEVLKQAGTWHISSEVLIIKKVMYENRLTFSKSEEMADYMKLNIFSSDLSMSD